MGTQHMELAGDLPLPLLKRALPSATNDEMLELAYQVLENLAERAESTADLALEADERDVENEALVFAREVLQLIPALSRSKRLDGAWFTANAAKEDVETAIRNRRARLEGRWSAVESYSHRRRQREQTVRHGERLRAAVNADKLMARANPTPKRVLAAIAKANAEVRVKDVAVALLPELANTKLAGRQRVINRISRVVLALAREGRIMQRHPEDTREGRTTCTYVIA